jgi:hypothetical protein
MATPRTTTNTLLRASIVVLTVGTALTHLQLNFPDPVFILNGLGYLALLAALYGPFPQLVLHRRAVRFVLVAYTGLTIGLWIIFGARSTIGYLNKSTEVLLVVLLVIEARRAA